MLQIAISSMTLSTLAPSVGEEARNNAAFAEVWHIPLVQSAGLWSPLREVSPLQYIASGAVLSQCSADADWIEAAPRLVAEQRLLATTRDISLPTAAEWDI